MRKLALPLVIALATTACGVVYKQPIYQGSLVEAAAVEQLQVGMSKQQVIALMGSPSISDPFHQQRWDYTASQRTGRIGRTEVRNLTLWFQDDLLTKWDGDHFPEQDAELVGTMRKSFGPNLPREKNPRGRR